MPSAVPLQSCCVGKVRSKDMDPIIPLDALRDRIAEAVAAHVKAQHVPAACARLGIQTMVEKDDSDEAFRSKRSYVKRRIVELKRAELLRIGEKVVAEYGAPELAETLSEMTTHSLHRVSPLVRRDVLKVLNQASPLFGELPLIDTLCEVFGENQIRSPGFEFLGRTGLEENIHQHCIRNDDWTNEELLTHCGAMSCSQTRFFSLLEKILDPMARRDVEQKDLAEALTQALKRDGFVVHQVAARSGYPIFGVARIQAGVAGAMKNIIFASTGEKPELVFRDAVNNDVEIVRNADKVLIYDRPLPASGMLLWKDLRGWWQEIRGIEDPATAKDQLYLRLLQSVRATNSPGEFAVFRGYYERYGSSLGEKLPALLPQVYLHYDPYTKRERGDELFLVRQRMDFLLMLDYGVRVVIEVDGRRHYAAPTAGGQGYAADPSRYAEMAAEDRRLRLAGYEVYRFGAVEFADVDFERSVIGPNAQAILAAFFDRLLRKHQVA